VQRQNYTLDANDGDTTRLLESWGGLDLATFNATSVLDSVSECVVDGCDESRSQGCADFADTVRTIGDPANGLSTETVGSLIPKTIEYCSVTNFRMDADIAGPGVCQFFPSSLTLHFKPLFFFPFSCFYSLSFFGAFLKTNWH